MNMLIIFFPLFNFLIASFFGRWLGKNGLIYTSMIIMSVNFVWSCCAFFVMGIPGDFYFYNFGTWITSDLFVVSWGFLFDTLTVSMLVVVNGVSTLVHIYSCKYMAEDPHIIRFLSYLSLFTFFMLILISADNFIQMFLGWEGVGLCSYLLISFWFTRVQANKAAIKALLVNRVGDFGLSLGIILVFCYYKSVNFSVIFCVSAYQESSTFFNNLICTLLFIGAIGKSAQVGLHTWLPDAMEGPTPVSALIHAATMVTAGVFLIIRCSPLFELAENTLVLITFFGALTSFFAATSGLVQYDLKKVIAYSTCSQLGYMILACGLSGYSASLFHLCNHAFFKALLFLAAGAVIHGLSNEQDMRRMGGLLKVMPFTYIMILIGSLSLMGFPFLTGFYSKDYILEFTISHHYNLAPIIFWFGTISASLTAFYSFRLIYLVFLTKTNMYKSYAKTVHELPFLLMGLPLLLLCFGSIFLGYLSKDMFIGLGSPLFNNNLPWIKESHHLYFSEEFVPYGYKILPFFFSLTGILILYLISLYKKLFNSFFLAHLRKPYKFLVFKWYFDMFYNVYINEVILKISKIITFKNLDRGLIEFLGPSGINQAINFTAIKLNKDYNSSSLISQVGYMIFIFTIIFYFFNIDIIYVTINEFKKKN